MSFLWAEATVAGFGMVAAIMSRIEADCRPAAEVSRLMSGLEDVVVCCRVWETRLSHAGWRGVFIAVGFWKRLLA